MAFFVVVLVLLGLLAVCWFGFMSTERQAKSGAMHGTPAPSPAPTATPAASANPAPSANPTPAAAGKQTPAGSGKPSTATPPEGV